MTVEAENFVNVASRDHVLLIGLNRPSKVNAFNKKMLDQLNAAYTLLEQTGDLRCAVVYAEGDNFTGGLDLGYFAEQWEAGNNAFAPEKGFIDAWGMAGHPRQKPVICAVQGRCYTLGIELMLAADIRVAASGTRFAQMEILRGIYPVGGATLRFPQEVGWGNAMRWLLTGEEFNAAEALRIGLIQEVVPDGKQLERALEIADRISAAAPGGVRATRESARRSIQEGYAAAHADLMPVLQHMLRETNDGKEGVRSFVERRAAKFTGT
ncbi:crotonase/enoyl-CoA hydratase family protein [Paraburkholderia caledonica]|uniref:Enoyl-CoA hydratase/carnithine racemase n=1 Tax=Paraburkholderia caledonica TaxID=134536 RepID=A0ABU1KYT2_9BURK|nr:crotonase/enoyl-CoA hydratase family protein [Paraburkholderia caledonica]MDR6376135.1 enoyl-CoA hydratase/carnithine racemase [Paraburkholderia caledonica]